MRFLLFTAGYGVSVLITNITAVFFLRSTGGEFTAIGLLLFIPILLFISGGIIALAEKLYFDGYVPAPISDESE